MPLYSTLIGVECGGRSVVGVILIPALGECVYAAEGTGRGTPCGMSRRGPPGFPTAVAGRRALSHQRGRQLRRVGRRDAYDRLQAAARLARSWGDGYGYLMVATGRAELMVDPIINLWDAAAIQPVIEEAGGTFTDWQGRPTIHSGQGIATNGRILDEVLAITRGAV